MPDPTVAEASRKVNETIAPSRPPEKKTEKQTTSYTFDVDWTSPQGRRYHGGFAAHIMTAKDTIVAGVRRAGLCSGLPPESLDAGTYNLAVQIATLEVVLDEQPDWSKDLVGLKELELIDEIYGEVKLREDRFCGRSGQDG